MSSGKITHPVPGSLGRKNGRIFYLSCIFCYIKGSFHLCQHSRQTNPTLHLVNVTHTALILYCVDLPIGRKGTCYYCVSTIAAK
jgi:hypothetical protein